MLSSLQATTTRAVLLAIPLLSASAFPAQAQTAYLVKDIDPTDSRFSVRPSGLARAGQNLFFLGCDDSNGCELWAADGASGEGKILRDVAPGPWSPFQQDFFPSVDLNGTLFLNIGYDLWKSDGTVSGTVKVATIGYASSFAAVGTVVYAASRDASSGQPFLWRSDGTPEGTRVVKEIQADSLTAVNGTLFFVGNDQVTGRELWKSDGTQAGTSLVRDIRPGPEGSLEGSLTRFGSQVIFDAFEGQFGHEPWISDGSLNGTHLIRDINPDFFGSDPYGFEVVGSVVYFMANDGVNATGPKLWKTDGTQANTTLVGEVPAYGLTNFNGALYFFATSTTDSMGLWTVDTAGPRLVKEVCVSCQLGGLSNTDRLVSAGGLLYFAVNGGAFTYDLWRTDGTAAGTYSIRGGFPGTNFGNGPREFTAVSNRLYFVANDADTNMTDLWRSDGTSSGTEIALNHRRAPSGPLGIVAVGPRAFFSANDGPTGREVWTSDGTSSGTSLVKDLLPGPDGGVEASVMFPRYPRIEFQQSLLFAASLRWPAQTNDLGLFRTDGTEAGTTQLLAGVEPLEFEIVGGVAYFSTATVDKMLWRTDGTVSGTWMVKGWGRSEATPTELTNVNGVLFFSGPGGLWKSNGTPEGTVLVKALSPKALTSLGGTLYFQDRASGLPLWKSDGTNAGTVAVRTGIQGFWNDYYKPRLTKAGSRLFFTWGSPGGGGELWRSDGTAAGTVPLKGFPSPVSRADGTSGLFYFAPGFYDYGYGLWKSDGTAANTVLVENLDAISDLVDVDGTLYFAAYDSEHGRELWKSDGTSAGTLLVQDIAPGPGSSNPQGFARAGSLVYFNADDGTTGAELWAFPVPDSAVALMVTPSPASQLTGSTVTFTWAAAAVATEYWLSVGTTFGGGQIYAGSQGLNLSKVVSGILADGRTVYVRLWTLFGGSWRSVDYTYTAAVPRPATMVTPAPGAVLDSSVATFTWDAGAGATAYWLYVGTSPGGKQIYPGSQVTNLSATVSGIPMTGAPVYVRLFSLIGGVWQHIDYTYTTTGVPTVSLTVSATTVSPGQSVQVTLQGGPGNLRDWIGLHASAGPDATYLDWKYLNGTRTIPAAALTSATLTFIMPTTAGTYNFRFFQNGGFTKLATSPTVTVGTVVSPLLNVTPASLAFGDVAVGTTVDKTVVVKNTGGGTLSGTGSVTGTGYSLIGTASYSLAANQEMTLTVRFAPTAPGSANGTLTLTGAAGASVPLMGNGTSTAPSLAIVGGVSTVAPGATIQLQVSNGPGFAKDWVGLHAITGADQAYLDWKYLNGTRTAPATGVTNATLAFTMPTVPGTYEFRLFQNNTYTRLATSPSVAVVVVTTPTLTVGATTATPGQMVPVTLQDGPGYPKDWIALAASGAANTSYLSWCYLNGTHNATSVGATAATIYFTMPMTPGTYEFRFFQDNTYTRLATSPTVTVQ